MIPAFAGVLAAVWLVPAPARAQSYTPAEEQEFHQDAARAIAHGALDEAEALAASRDARDPSAAALRARLLIARGQYAEAESVLTPVAQGDRSSAAGLQLGLLLASLGRATEARPYLDAVLSKGGGSPDPLDHYRGGLAARALGEYRQANSFLRAAAQASLSDAETHTTWAELFLEKYNQSDALRSFQDALTIDEEWSPAHLGMARALMNENPPLARQSAERALAINPNSTAAHLLIAEMELDDRSRDAAREAIDRALAINPRSLEARALLAAVAYLEDRADDFEAEVARALEINPVYGEVYRIAGARAAGAYRFPEAAELVRRAVALDPGNTRAHAELGLHLLRTGDEPAARAALDRSFADDPFDVVTFNLLSMMDTLGEFETFERGDLIVRLHPDEAPALKEYVLTLAQEAVDTLSARYAMTVQGPILIEVFPRHDDFAVRNLGLPGMIGALGACFGSVVTMDSPRARPPGDFNWQSTLWHEIAHVITLQMSKQRLPRWLSEGISTYEEKRAKAAWGRDQVMEFATALNNDQVLSLRDLNSGFSRPDTISLAYFQASILVEHIIDQHGEPALQTLIRAYGDGLETDAALARIGLDFDALQSSFDATVDTQFGALRRALDTPEGESDADAQAQDGASEESDTDADEDAADRLEALRGLAAEHDGSYQLQVALGRALYAANELDDARAAFVRAVELAPMATGFDSPRGVLARIAEQQGDGEAAMRHLERLLDYDETSLDAARLLAALAEEAGDDARLRLAYERLIEIDPFDPIPHQALGRFAMADGRHDAATLELEVALALGPVDRVAAHSDLAENLLASGEYDAAKRQAMAALEIAPTYERAQELLLRAVEAGP